MNSRDKQQGEPVRPMSEQDLLTKMQDEIACSCEAVADVGHRYNCAKQCAEDLLPIIRDYVRQQSAPDDLLELAIEMAIAYCNGFSPQIYPEIPKRPTPDDVRKRYEERRNDD